MLELRLNPRTLDSRSCVHTHYHSFCMIGLSRKTKTAIPAACHFFEPWPVAQWSVLAYGPKGCWFDSSSSVHNLVTYSIQLGCMWEATSLVCLIDVSLPSSLPSTSKNKWGNYPRVRTKILYKVYVCSNPLEHACHGSTEFAYRVMCEEHPRFKYTRIQ